MRKAFDKLETLEMMWCGDLSVAFHFYNTPGTSVSLIIGWRFFKLKHIRLHELPKLKNICNIGIKISMPELETINIRGCWSLRTLPFVDSKNVVECDCEKEWWDRLEWESVQHARHYKPIHPRYSKKTMLRGSVLRFYHSAAAAERRAHDGHDSVVKSAPVGSGAASSRKSPIPCSRCFDQMDAVVRTHPPAVVAGEEPRDARLVRKLLRSVGFREGEYGARVVHQFVEVARRYAGNMLVEARAYGDHAGRASLEADDVRHHL